MCLSHRGKFSSVIVKQKRKGHPPHMNVTQRRSHRGLANSSRHARNVSSLGALMCFLDIIYTCTAKMWSGWIHPRLSVSTLNWFDLFLFLMCLVPAWGRRRFHSVWNLENIDEFFKYLSWILNWIFTVLSQLSQSSRFPTNADPHKSLGTTFRADRKNFYLLFATLNCTNVKCL